MTNSPDQKIGIISAANILFATFGYQKTTMADIAKEASMSPANIYRFFKSKNGLLAATASGWFEDSLKNLRQISDDPDFRPAKKLKRITLSQLNTVFMGITYAPKMSEAIDELMVNHHEMLADHGKSVHSLISDILAQGVTEDDFAIEDIKETALLFIEMTVRFTTPANVVIGQLPLARLEEMAVKAVDIFVKGIGASLGHKQE